MPVNALIIAGMHRSGTSLISQWLIRCGLHLGHTLLGAGPGNSEGHFEDLDFLRFHSDTLDAHQLSDTGFSTEPVKCLSFYQKEKLKRIIDLKNEINNQWGWKDPRTCLFLSHYRELMPGAFYLHIIRDYKSTVSSMIHRDFNNYETKYLARHWLSRQVWHTVRRSKHRSRFYHERAGFYLKVWIRYNEEILKNIQTLPSGQFMVIDHRNLFNRDKEVFDQLTASWNFDLIYCDFKSVFKENLLSDVVNVDDYIADQQLIKKALRLEELLRQHI